MLKKDNHITKIDFLENQKSVIMDSELKAKILTRIFVDQKGNLVITDLWQDVEKKFLEGSGGSFERNS